MILPSCCKCLQKTILRSILFKKPMKIATAIYVRKPGEKEVLLAFKQKVVGIDKLFPYGGKFEPIDKNNPFLCSRRETLEETNDLLELQEDKFTLYALIDFYNGDIKSDEPSFRVLFFICESFVMKTTNLKDLETKGDMENPNWYDFDKIPSSLLRSGDKLFVPRILNGEKVKGWIWFDNDGNIIDSEIVLAEEEDLVI